MNADGSGRETIANHWGSPRWSPRGNRIASILNGNLALYDVATGAERSVLPGQYSLNLGFGIAPDGRRFCFGDGNGIHLATLDETRMTASVRLLAKGGACNHASFAPDGRRVVVNWRAPDKPHSQLYIVELASNDAPVALKGQDSARSNTNPDWSPDGKTILFASHIPNPPATEE
jgi:Tol biopolymer transport system component